MNFQIVILFIVTAIIEKALTNECGTTTSRQDGNTATITYRPNPHYVNHSRTWVHSFGYSAPYLPPVIVFDGNSTASRSTKYIEEGSGGAYVLKIHNVAINDSGLYSVRCYTGFPTTYYMYSASADLQIRSVPTTTTSSYNPSIKPVSAQTTTSSNTTGQQTVTTPHIQTEEKSLHQEKEDGAMIAPVIGGVVGTVVVVVACAVLLTVYHKRCKKKKAQLPAEQKAKGSITAHLLGENGNAEMTLTTEEIPEYASVIPKDQRKGAVEKEEIADGSYECPEYSEVVPKSERTSDAKNNIQTKSICNTTEAANQLVYAELDLQHQKANTKDPEQRKETDNVQVDHSKTGSSHDSTRVAEQLEQTEYVTIDFSKTE